MKSIVLKFFLLSFPSLCFAQNLPNDVIINEFIANPTVGKEWIELLVVKPGGVDMRNWRITDLGGPTSAPSATEGVLTFPNTNYLANVPLWTRVVIVLKTPDSNVNTFVQDTISSDRTLVLFTVGIPGGVLDSTRTLDLSATDNCVLLDGQLTTGAVVDVVSWGGSITGWPPLMWSNNLTVSGGNGAFFKNAPDSCSANNDNGQQGWVSNVTAANLTPGLINTGQHYPVPGNGRRWVGTSPAWIDPFNWCPIGPPDGMHILIGPSALPPILLTQTNILSLTIERGGKLEIAPSGKMFVQGDISAHDSIRINSLDTLWIGGRFLVDTFATVRISSPVTIPRIGDDVTIIGKLLVDAGVSPRIWCEGDWIRKAGSSFVAGSSSFYFRNATRSLNVDRGTFFHLYLGPVRDTLKVLGNVNVNGTLWLRDTVSVRAGDTLAISNTAANAIRDTLGGIVASGSLRRFIDTTAVGLRYQFHDGGTSVRFDSGAPVQSLNITSYPNSFLGQTGSVKRWYDVGETYRGPFRARVCFSYRDSEVQPGVVESQLRLYRISGADTFYVGGTVDTVNNVICADTVREFSRWSFGVPFGPTSVENTPDLPGETRLLQNYPNPFNPVTTIRFELRRAGFVALRIYDVLGREVATLANEHMAAGRFERSFDARGFASGLYFVRFQVGSYLESKKMVLIR